MFLFLFLNHLYLEPCSPSPVIVIRLQPEGADRLSQFLTRLSRHKEPITLPSGGFVIAAVVVTGICFIFD